MTGAVFGLRWLRRAAESVNLINDALIDNLRAQQNHRPGGPWDADDYDVLDGERHVGRILRTHAVLWLLART
jgi:hypothetical protein